MKDIRPAALYILLMVMVLGGLDRDIIPKPEWSTTGFGSLVYVVFLMFVCPWIVVTVLGWVFGVSPFSPKVEYPSNWADLSLQAKDRDGYKCGNCGEGGKKAWVTFPLHVHHIVPLSKGGTNNLSNLRTLCEDCHKRLHPHML